MYGLEVRIGSIRGLVALHVYRVLLEEVRSLLAEVDQQSRRVGSLTTEPSHMTWAVRHEQDATGLKLRLEPFELDVDQQRVLRAAEAGVVGIHQLEVEPVIPPFYTEDAVSTLAKFAARRGSDGVDRLDLAAVNGQVLDEAEVNETVRRNAGTSVAPATTAVGSIVGVVDALQGGAKASRWVAVDRFVAVKARELSLRLRKRLSGADGVHLATAVLEKAAFFMTMDQDFPFDSTIDGVSVTKPLVVWQEDLCELV